MGNRLSHLSSKVGKRRARRIIRRTKSNSFRIIQKQKNVKDSVSAPEVEDE